ncbi:TetR/AcrR family transcriptional regulator [Streptomyces cylindrosporus]|uniref:TetR/AcrR family transcriptional regulator n=1 Tax=Streptomyces cylindrosporus TaxID=2927583 RepID=A0ABS9YKK3_9ACTN|nr:TetR/AcrR family transcriptional regulator [Streptomyces cylindrosporus]MCI3277798.1 TetR/AcrR family transcriptional regulator [Streptomyces cylindrosporus]
MTTARTIRQRAHDDFVREIRDIARRLLAQHGIQALSLRAVAREIGVTSSALYRYFPGRAALLNALADDAHHNAADFVEHRVADCAPATPALRWRTACHALRAWAHEHPHEFALLYAPAPAANGPGSPAPAASRIPLLLAGILTDHRDADTMPRMFTGWTQLIGAITLETSGHLRDHGDTCFNGSVDLMTAFLLPPPDAR